MQGYVIVMIEFEGRPWHNGTKSITAGQQGMLARLFVGRRSADLWHHILA